MEQVEVDLRIEPDAPAEIIALRLASFLIFKLNVSTLVTRRAAIIKTVKVVHTVKIELTVDGT
jgi:hypothetical protein